MVLWLGTTFVVHPCMFASFCILVQKSGWVHVRYSEELTFLPVGYGSKNSFPYVGILISAIVELIEYQKSFSSLGEITVIEELY